MPAFRIAFRSLAVSFSLAAATPAVASTVLVQTNLTSDGKVKAAFTDPNLKNPWGISFSPTGPFWVSDNATGLTTVYGSTGSIAPLVVSIPTAAGGTGLGSPTGQVFNPSPLFTVSKGGKTAAPLFIFATEDGTISGWAPSVDANAVLAVDRSKAHAVYKGLALYASKVTLPRLLAADFRTGLIDVFDGQWKLVASFRDTALPASYTPYNVAVLHGGIYVTYAVADKLRHDSVSGAGLGVVERIDITGKVLARFEHGQLNAPWGLALAPANFGIWANRLLVGNFGDGHVTAFSVGSLQPAGQLTTASGPLAIDGLWGLSAGNGASAGSKSEIYFTAGINGEADGLFGSLSVAP